MRFSALLPLVMACLLSALAPGLARAEKDPHGILARRVGVWNATVNIKTPVKMTFKGQEKIGWVLGHNYVLGKGFYDDKGDGKKTEVINLMTYSEKDKRYYIWEFKANGDVQPAPLTGTWDEEKKEMTLKANDGGNRGEGVWKFEKDGSFSWSFEVKDENDKTIFSMDGSQVKAEKTDSGTKTKTTK
ncbi:MAG: hypothetical protein VX431_01900 [Planctomycetota bacterium]|nr:hypothetical protein [Planctomycetota bacterium]